MIKGSLSAEVGPVLIGVVSHAGSPRPESPTRQGSVAHIGREALALQQETSVEQASSVRTLLTFSLPMQCLKCGVLVGRSALKDAYLACSKADCQLTLYISDSLSNFMKILPSHPARQSRMAASLVLCVHQSDKCMVPIPADKPRALSWCAGRGTASAREVCFAQGTALDDSDAQADCGRSARRH